MQEIISKNNLKSDLESHHSSDQGSDQDFDKGFSYTQPTDISFLITRLRSSIWAVGIPSWLFGITDRGVSALADGVLSPGEVLQLIMASLLFMSWLYLKPEEVATEKGLVPFDEYKPNSNLYRDELYPYTARSRMAELQKEHLISQEYTLPFPYLCQIYHLLNLKHLENVHSFSLNNLRVLEVSDVQKTQLGGVIKFQTVLESSFNALRIWRQPVVEVELTLHNPYTVELKIPVYGNKYIVVMFNALPINSNEHKFFVDIYSNLNYPRLPMQVILHFASCLTLFEDLPYLGKLAEINVARLATPNRTSSHETMWLFNRYVDLYGARLNDQKLEPTQAMKLLPEAA